jgi:hypothetical protein
MNSVANVGSAAAAVYSSSVQKALSLIASHNGSEANTTEALITSLAELTTTTQSPTTISIITSTAAALEAATTQVFYAYIYFNRKYEYI